MVATPTSEELITGREQVLEAYVRTLDEPALAEAYRADDGVLVLPQLLPAALVAEMAAEGRRLARDAVRKHVPFVRKARAVPHRPIAASAPALHALHRSAAMMRLFERVTGVPLDHRPPDEAHQSALYVYDRKGDYMDWHYDECGCPPEDSFSTIIGLVDDSSSRLEIETRRDRPGEAPLRRAVHTVPGTFAFFCGTRAYHRVTPLGDGEERITFAFTYVRKGRKPGGIYDLRMRIGNALVYFGLGH